MKIVIDHQIFASQQYGGISRYFFELLQNYKNMSDVDAKLSIKFSGNYYLLEGGCKVVSSPYKANFKGRGQLFKLLNILNEYNTNQIIKKGNFDIFHPTYYNPYFLEHMPKDKPFVLTVYDMIHELYPQYFKKGDVTTEHKKIVVNKADKIIAISNSTKNDLINLFNVDEKKIDVVYLSSSMESGNIDKPTEISVPERYILFVGHRGGYKNFNTFFEAISETLIKDNSLYIVCAGATPFTKDEILEFEKYKLTDRVLKYPGDNATLVKLYQNALAFVFSSLYEGFGLPILESMQCGCPSILSNSSSLPEVGEQAAEYFDPKDLESIKNSVEKVIYNSDYRSQLITRGYEQCKKFDWAKTAEETIKCYRSIL